MDTKKKVTTGNGLMDLRLAILRTISDVWEDDHKTDNRWEKMLVNAPYPVCQDLLQQYQGNGAAQQGGLLRYFITNAPMPVLNWFLFDEYGYFMPFANFNVYFIAGNAIWNLYGDNSWTKPQEETITLTLPAKEDSWDQYDQTVRLMEYYNYFPYMFGSLLLEQDEPEEVEEAEPAMLSRSISTQTATAQAGSDMYGNDYNLGVSSDSFLGFGAVISKVIAVAWNNPAFKNIIDYDARWAKYQSLHTDPVLADFEKIYFPEMINVLSEHFDFDFPWVFQVKFVFAMTAAESQAFGINGTYERPYHETSRLSFWEYDGKEWEWRMVDENGDINLIRNTVSLELPITPLAEENNVSLALARYNAIGPAFPFTCS